MIISRVSRRRVSGSMRRVVEAAVGLGAPAFFIHASDIDTTNHTWLDTSDIARVGTFQNTNYSILDEGSRKFVRLSNNRCLFPSTVFDNQDVAVVCIASFRPPISGGYWLAGQPRDGAQYAWATGYNPSFGLLEYAYTDLWNQVETTYTRGAVRPGSWTVTTSSWLSLPPSAFGSGSGKRTVSLNQYVEAGITTYSGKLELHSPTNIPFYVGGGYSGAAFNGDIEWLAIWKVRTDSATLRAAYRRLSGLAYRRDGYGVPPKKAPPCQVYLRMQNANASLTLAAETGIPAYTTAASQGAPTGSKFIVDGKYIAETIGVMGGSLPAFDGKFVNPPNRGAIFRASTTATTHLVRMVANTSDTPQWTGPGASAYARTRDTISIGTFHVPKSLPTLLVVSGKPAYTPAPEHAPHLSPKVLHVQYWDTGLFTEPSLYGRVRLEDAVFTLRDLSLEATVQNNSQYSLNTLRAYLMVRDVSGDFRIDCVDSSIFLHNAYAGYLFGDTNVPYVLPTEETLASVRLRQLRSHPASSYTFIVARGSYVEAANVTYVGASRFASLKHSKLRARHSYVDDSLRYIPPGSVGYVPLVDTESPGGAVAELLGISVEGNWLIGEGSISGNDANMQKTRAQSHIYGVGHANQTVGPVSGFRMSGVVDTATYKTDMADYADVGSRSFARFNTDNMSPILRADSPLRSTKYVELLADVPTAGTTTFEIDFILETTDTSYLTDPRGVLALAIFYKDTSDRLRVYRDTPTRIGAVYYASSAYTLVSKPAASTWTNVNASHVSGSRIVTLDDVGEGTVRMHVFLGSGEIRVRLHPVVRVT